MKNNLWRKLVAVSMSVGMFVSCTPVGTFAEDLSISEDDVIVIDSQESSDDLEETVETQVSDNSPLFEEVNEATSETNEISAITELPMETESETECVAESDSVLSMDVEKAVESATEMATDDISPTYEATGETEVTAMETLPTEAFTELLTETYPTEEPLELLAETLSTEASPETLTESPTESVSETALPVLEVPVTENEITEVPVTETVIADDIVQAETQEVTEIISEPSSTDESIEENSTEVATETEFSESKVVDGVVISVNADQGVLPDGAILSVNKVTTAEEQQAVQAVDEVRDDRKNVAASYTFDISIFDRSGNEIQPDGNVSISFAMEEVADDNLTRISRRT